MKSELLGLLTDPTVQQALAESVQPQVIASLQDPNVKQELLTSLDMGAVLSDPALKRELVASIDVSSLLADPSVKRELAASIDAGSLLADPAVKQQLLASFDLPTLLSDPTVMQQLRSVALSQTAPEMSRSLAQQMAQDAQKRESYHLALTTTWLGATLLFVTYALVAVACLLTGLAFSLYLVGFVTTSAFQLVWLHIFQLPRTVLAILATCRLPSAAKLIETVAADVNNDIASKEAAGLAHDGSTDLPESHPSSASLVISSVLKVAVPPLAPLLTPLMVFSVLCALFDAVALISACALCWTVGQDEQLALSVLLSLTVGLALVDFSPFWLIRPLLKWSLPASTYAALVRSISVAITSAKGAVSKRKPTPSGKVSDQDASAGAPSNGEAMNKPMLTSYDTDVPGSLPPPRPPPGPPPPMGLPFEGERTRHTVRDSLTPEQSRAARQSLAQNPFGSLDATRI